MDDPALFLWGVWAVYRLTSLLHEDKIMQPLRRLLGEHITLVEVVSQEIRVVDGVPKAVPVTTFAEKIEYTDTFFGNLIRCFRCVSVWAALFVIIAWYVFPPVVVLLALSGLSIVVREYFKV